MMRRQAACQMTRRSTAPMFGVLIAPRGRASTPSRENLASPRHAFTVRREPRGPVLRGFPSRSTDSKAMVCASRASTARPRRPRESDHKGAHRFAPRVIESLGLADLELGPLMCPITARTVNRRKRQ
ncbi:hypothetical protein Taro_015081 [Colocasia esculenta]|uniref:Uncharacterized protein n=1 Tax=Colocasia esculenta TaxID=4460 RepID=A0A843UKG4_COLES|nr:hypothetical protein [Colocasia esculenta]